MTRRQLGEKKRPVNEGCDDAAQGRIMSEKQAKGILVIHDACEPPCRRKQTALHYLGIPIEERAR